MDASDYAYGVCGVFCEQCASGNGRIKELASELLRLTRDINTVDGPKIDAFDFDEFQGGLTWFTEGYGCPTCLQVEKPWCAVMKCEKAKELGNCLLCDEVSECPHNEYQRTRYAYLLEHHERVKEVGLERYYAEEREKARKGTLLHDIREY